MVFIIPFYPTVFKILIYLFSILFLPPPAPIPFFSSFLFIKNIVASTFLCTAVLSNFLFIRKTWLCIYTTENNAGQLCCFHTKSMNYYCHKLSPWSTISQSYKYTTTSNSEPSFNLYRGFFLHLQKVLLCLQTFQNFNSIPLNFLLFNGKKVTQIWIVHRYLKSG